MLRKIWRFIKRIFGILFILLFLVVIALIIFFMTFDLNRYKDLAAQKLTTILDRPVKIESMHTKLALIPTITITGFKIENNEPFQDKAPLLFIQKMDAELELAPLLNSQINIHKITLDEASINLFKNKDTNNWILSPAPQKNTQNTAPSKSNAKIDLQKSIRLNIVTIGVLKGTFEDSGKKYTASINNLEMKNFHMLSGEILYNKQKFNFNLNAGSIFDLLNQTPNFPYDIKVQSRLANITLNGKIGDFKALTGLQTTLSIRTNNLKNLLSFMGITHALIPTQNAQLQLQTSGSTKELAIKQLNFNINSDKDLMISGTGTLRDLLQNPVLTLDTKAQLQENKLSELWHVQPMTLTGDFTMTPTSFKTKTTTLDANRSDMRLAADAQLKGKILNISLAVGSNFLNIYDFIKKQDRKSEESNQQTPKQSTAQKVQIPWDMMKKINLNLNLNINHLQANDWFTDYIGVTTQSTLYDGVLKFPFELSTLNGKITGTINANSNNQTIGYNITGSNLNLNGLRPLNQEIQNVVLQTKLNGTTKGATIDHLINNLNGKIIAETNQGEIINKWFVSLPKALNLTKKKQNVSFSNNDTRFMITCAAANIDIKNGVITGKDQLALETNMLDLIAGGSIDLPQKTMNILIHPSISDGTADDWTALSKYIRIAGPFDKLKPTVDTEQVTNSLIKTGINKLAGIETQETTTPKTSGGLCQNVLGNNALIQKAKAKTTNEQPKSQPQARTQQSQKKGNQKQQFEKELLNSLFQALTPQQQ